MPTRIASASNASSSTQPTPSPSFAARLFALGALAGLALAGCKSVPPAPVPELPPVYAPASFRDLPGWRDDPLDEAVAAFRLGCRALADGPRAQPLWRVPCEAAAADLASATAARTFFETHFSPWRIAHPDGRETGLVTGYYEPVVPGSRTRTDRYGVPLRAVPVDLLRIEIADRYPALKDERVRGRLDGERVVPYWPRERIVAGDVPVAGAALAYVADPLDAFLLQVQGSGRIALADGTTLRLGYADQNGHPYRSIGRVLVERGELPLERSSLQAIRAWARANPERIAALLNENPSYVFFRELPAAPGAPDEGPPGSLGVPLSRERSIAVDPRAIPLGAPVWLATTRPGSAAPLERLTFAQDTGGAIRGAVRADFYWGSGDTAGEAAGTMREQGRLWVLWPRGAGAPQPR